MCMRCIPCVCVLVSSMYPLFNALLGGNDYVGEIFSVAFPAGETVISFSVPIVDDDNVETNEQFTLYLEIPDDAAATSIVTGTQYAANVTIVNDDG